MKKSVEGERDIISEKHVIWFAELGKEDTPTAGGKGANLGEMFNSGFPVPPGFVIIAGAYQQFLEETNLEEKIYEILNKLDMEKTKELEVAAKGIQKLIVEAEMPNEIKEEILESYESLSVDRESMSKATSDALTILKRAQEPVFVAVRSSATAEDTAAASFAGQNETFLNIKGKFNVIEAVKKCWASLFTARSIYYRIKKGFKHEQVLIAVVVQMMVNSDKSGVIFSIDPVTQNENVIVEAVFGLGEGIVSGQIQPDHYLVSRDLKILSKGRADKKIALVRNSSGHTETVKLTEEKSKSQVLSEYEIKKLSDYSIKLEEHYGKPQDTEFAIDSGNIYIVQTRPITTLEKKEAGKEEKRDFGKEILEGIPASPGIGSGPVRIIHSLEELEKIKPGDILVTEMTNPDMVIAMQKSAGIVTNEGGMTCFSGDSRVLTTRGFMEIKDAYELVKSNQEVIILAYDTKEMKSKWKKIIDAGRRISETIRISCSQTGRIEENTIDLTPDHRMIMFDNRDLIKNKVSSILENNEMICLIDRLPLGARLSDYKKAYLVGALLSDGYCKVMMHHTGNPRRGVITFTQKETPEKKEFIEIVKEYYREIFNEEFIGRSFCSNSILKGRSISGSATHFTSTKLAPAFEISRISQNLDRWMLRLDEVSSLNFLAGLIDGDGCFLNNRLHIYVSKENILQGIILSCLNLGIFPQITKNRNIHHVQILERMPDILQFTKRVKGIIKEKVLGNKLFSAKQILGDIIDKVNFKGRIKPYVTNNLLIDSRKLSRILGLCDEKNKQEIIKIINSGLRMQRVKKISEMGEMYVYNLEVDADNEIDHNFIVFTKKYTPLLVSNSHAAIVSREMGIACVVGTDNATKILKDGQEITVNGYDGKIYEGRTEGKKVEIGKVMETETKIKVIVDLPDFASRAAESGIKHVGLTRIEGIIAESGKHPFYFLKQGKVKDYEKVIFTGVSKIAEYFDEIWVRTSDIRSDEFRNVEGAPQAVELNPMMGMHGIRFSLKYPELLEAELLALKKVSDSGKKIGIILPQVISVEEVRKVKEIIHKLDFHDVKTGIMIETPAAVQIIEELCQEGIDFISFGTNDLTQFTLAIDRGNDQLQELYDELHPAMKKQLASVIDVCKIHGVETSICGQAASNEEMAEFLVLQGIDSLSVNADKAYDISKLVKELEEKGLRGSKSEYHHLSMAKKTKKETKGKGEIEQIDNLDEVEKKAEGIKEKVRGENEKRAEDKKKREDKIVIEEDIGDKDSKTKDKKEKEGDEYPAVDIGFNIFEEQGNKEKKEEKKKKDDDDDEGSGDILLNIF